MSKLDAIAAKHQSSLHLIAEQASRLVQMDERLYLVDHNDLKVMLPVSPYVSKIAISSGTKAKDQSFGWQVDIKGQSWQSTAADDELLKSCNVVNGQHYWSRHIRTQGLVFCTGWFMQGQTMQSIAILINMPPCCKTCKAIYTWLMRSIIACKVILM
ncbi:hypothetical protein [Undibacterium sp. YM2]|uniref:hypothetical protein n=1 Tax=Undibacterium sp. YM2 TaxID=2058625 RepID=UPI00138951BD|nr:hypothetical protein [Undibacterium sp. YM2]